MFCKIGVSIKFLKIVRGTLKPDKDLWKIPNKKV